MNTENKNELDKQNKTIKKSLAIVFIPIIIFLITVILIQNNSENYLEKEYKKNNSLETLSDWKKVLPNDFEFNEIRLLLNHFNHKKSK